MSKRRVSEDERIEKTVNAATLKLPGVAHVLLKLLAALTLQEQKELIQSLLIRCYEEQEEMVRKTVDSVMERQFGENWRASIEQDDER